VILEFADRLLTELSGRDLALMAVGEASQFAADDRQPV